MVLRVDGICLHSIIIFIYSNGSHFWSITVIDDVVSRSSTIGVDCEMVSDLRPMS